MLQRFAGWILHKNWVGGFLLKPDFYQSYMSEEEKEKFIREELTNGPG
jgi:hypothetical protein